MKKLLPLILTSALSLLSCSENNGERFVTYGDTSKEHLEKAETQIAKTYWGMVRIDSTMDVNNNGTLDYLIVGLGGLDFYSENCGVSSQKRIWKRRH